MKKREYRCYYDGQQEEKYFKHVAKKIKDTNPNASIKFKKVNKLNVLDGSSTDVPKIAVFDYDLNKTEFEKKVKLCKRTRILYSNLNFDLWLLLHKKKFKKSVTENNDYIDEVRKAYKLDTTADIKKEDNINRILEQIGIEDIKFAIENAEEIMNEKLESDKILVKKGFSYYENPSMSIHEFFKELFLKLDIN